MTEYCGSGSIHDPVTNVSLAWFGVTDSAPKEDDVVEIDNCMAEGVFDRGIILKIGPAFGWCLC